MALVFLALSLTRCVTVPPGIPMASGPPQLVRCDTDGATMQGCWDQAGRICPHGFFILDADGNAIPQSFFEPFNGKIIAIANRAAMIQCQDDPSPTKYMPEYAD